MSDASFWSDLERRVGQEGVTAVLGDQQQTLDADVRRALELEAHHLRDWDPAAQPGLLAQQMLTRMHGLGNHTRTAEIIQHINEQRHLVLSEVWRTGAFSSALLRTLAGHTTAITDAAFTPDGQLYSVATDGEIRLWDVDTGGSTPVVVLAFPADVDGPPPSPQRLAVSPDGTLLAVAFNISNTIQIVATADRTIRATLHGHSRYIERLRFFPDGTRLASSGQDHTVRIWNVRTGTLLHTLRGHTNQVRGLAVSRDGEVVVSGSHDKTLRRWDTATGMCRQIVDNGDASWVLGVAFACNDARLLTCSASGAVHQFRNNLGELRDRVELHAQPADRCGPGVAWSITPLGYERVLVTNDDAVVDVWTTVPQGPTAREQSLLGHGGPVTVAAATADGRFAVTGDDRGALLLWKPSSGQSPDTPLGLYHGVRQIAVSKAAALVAYSSDWELRIRAVSMRTGRHSWQIRDETETGPFDVWFSADGQQLYTTDNDVLQHRSNTTGRAHSRQLLGGWVIGRRADAAITVASQHATRPHQIALVDARNGSVVRLVDIPDLPDVRHCADLTPDFTTVVLGTKEMLLVWHPKTGEVITISFDTEGVPPDQQKQAAFLADVAIDDEGCHAIGVDEIGRAHIWDIHCGHIIDTVADSARCRSVAGLAQHHALTVGTADGMAIVWDLAAARPACVAPLDSTLTAAAVDGNTIAVGDGVGNAHILNLIQGSPTPPPPPAAPSVPPSAADPPPHRSWWLRLLES